MVKVMVRDVFSFAIVYLVCIAGFMIAFRGLFFGTEAFQNNSQVFLNIFTLTLGNPEFSVFEADSCKP